MHLRFRLLNIAAIAAAVASAACGSQESTEVESADAAPQVATVDAATPVSTADAATVGQRPVDAGEVIESGIHGPPEAGCPAAYVSTQSVAPDTACAISGDSQWEGMPQGTVVGPACDLFCKGLNSQIIGVYWSCHVPESYYGAYDAAQLDAGDAGTDGGSACPSWSGLVVIQCAPAHCGT
jgi:hypothetical protein